MFGWLRQGRKAAAIPDQLWATVLQRYPFLAARSQAERARLRELSGEFLATKQFHGAHGFEITDEVAVSIAAQAVLPVLHLGLSWYDDFVGIVVHRGDVLARREVTDADGVVHEYAEALSGEAMAGGPVMLSWHDVAAAGDTATQGYNVVIHEFVHKIDMRSGAPDGCPALPSLQAREHWLEVMTTQYEAFREKAIIAERFGGDAPWLDRYGATSIDEFFAVACEAYFVNRERFALDFGVLVPLFDGFFSGG